jgi:hypothetical protein
MTKAIKLNSKINLKENTDLQQYVLKKAQLMEKMPVVTEEKLKEFKRRGLIEINNAKHSESNH